MPASGWEDGSQDVPVDGVIQGFTPNPVTGFNPEPVTGFNPEPVTGFNPEPVTGFTPEAVSGLDPNPVTGFVPQPVQGFRGGIDTRKNSFDSRVNRRTGNSTGRPGGAALRSKPFGSANDLRTAPLIVGRQPDRPLSTVDLTAPVIEWAGVRIVRGAARGQ